MIHLVSEFSMVQMLFLFYILFRKWVILQPGVSIEGAGSTQSIIECQSLQNKFLIDLFAFGDLQITNDNQTLKGFKIRGNNKLMGKWNFFFIPHSMKGGIQISSKQYCPSWYCWKYLQYGIRIQINLVIYLILLIYNFLRFNTQSKQFTKSIVLENIKLENTSSYVRRS